MRWNTVKTFSVCWSRGWVRQGKNSKVSESSLYKKENTLHTQHMWAHVCTWHTDAVTFAYRWGSRYQKTTFFYSPSWEAKFPDVCWNWLGYQIWTLPLCQTPAFSWPCAIHFSSSPSLWICKMKLLILLSFTKCIWDALISHKITRKSYEKSYTRIYNPKRRIMEMRAGKTF